MIQLLIDPIQNQLRVIETDQQRARAALLLRGEQMVPASNRACTLTESLGAQHFTANRANEFFAGSSIAGAAK
jgi:hypothetical protein